MAEAAYNQRTRDAYESAEPVTGVRVKGPEVPHPKVLAMSSSMRNYSASDYRLLDGSEMDISDQLSNL